MPVPIECPACGNQEIRKAGLLRRKKIPERQQYQCKKCRRVFVLETSTSGPIVVISNGVVTLKQRVYRSTPELDPYIDGDRESFQSIVDSCLRKRYKLSQD